MNVINEFHYTHDATKQTVKIVDELKTGKWYRTEAEQQMMLKPDTP